MGPHGPRPLIILDMTAYESLGLFLWHDMRTINSRVGALTSIRDADRGFGRLWFDSFTYLQEVMGSRIHPLNPIVQAGDPK